MVHELIQENYPQAQISPAGSSDLAIPKL